MPTKTKISGKKLKPKQQVKTAKKRKPSSTKWLQRQLNDHYVEKAIAQGYRSRACFKLLEIDDKLKILKDAKTIVDLGCAPGGWLQVCQQYGASNAKIIGIDLLEIDKISGIDFIQGDFTEDEVYHQLLDLTQDGVDIVLSDMAPSTIGHKQTDHLRIMALVELAWDFALNNLNNNGHLVTKIFQGGESDAFYKTLQKHFDKVKFFKPKSSRKDSAETFIVATGFKKC